MEIVAMGVFDARKSLQMGISPLSDDGHTQSPLQDCLELRSSDRLARFLIKEREQIHCLSFVILLLQSRQF